MDLNEVFGVFESSSDPNASLVIAADEDVAANVVLTSTSPPPKPTPRPLKFVKVIIKPRNGVKTSRNNVAANVTEPPKPVVHNVIEDYAISEPSKPVVHSMIEEYTIQRAIEQITPRNDRNDEIAEFTQNEDDDTEELTGELQSEPPVKEVVQYELPYPGGSMQQVKVEVTDEHDQAFVAESEYFCGVCGKSYASEKSVRTHMTRTHSHSHARGGGAGAGRRDPATNKRTQKAQKVMCQMCGKSCPSTTALRYHERTHTGERPYQCTMCPKAYPMPLNLQIHLRTHTGERPYACPQCPKTFISASGLHRHKYVHTGIKPYRCEQCGKAFSQSNTRKLHILTVHLKMPWPYMSKQRSLKQLRRQGELAQMDTAANSDSPED